MADRITAPPDHRHFYDQIVWFADTPGVPALSMAYANGGMFDFTPAGLILAATRVQLSWRISDHFPSGSNTTYHPEGWRSGWSWPSRTDSGRVRIGRGHAELGSKSSGDAWPAGLQLHDRSPQKPPRPNDLLAK